MLQPSTLNFIKQLKGHNDRPWFNEHKEQYQKAKADFDQLIQQLLLEYGKTDPLIAQLEVKDCVFRIYRDIRFSKDKTPYKTHFAAGINKGGKRVHFPGYFLHIEPGKNSYAGGGIWRPEKEKLRKVRQEIDYGYNDFLAIIHKKSFQKTFGTLAEYDKLKRPPKGYEKDNPAIEYLKLRSFTASCPIKDKDLTEAGLVKQIVQIFKQLKPFVDFLEMALDG